MLTGHLDTSANIGTEGCLVMSRDGIFFSESKGQPQSIVVMRLSGTSARGGGEGSHSSGLSPCHGFHCLYHQKEKDKEK